MDAQKVEGSQPGRTACGGFPYQEMSLPANVITRLT